MNKKLEKLNIQINIKELIELGNKPREIAKILKINVAKVYETKKDKKKYETKIIKLPKDAIYRKPDTILTQKSIEKYIGIRQLQKIDGQPIWNNNDIITLRNMYDAGFPDYEIGKKFGITKEQTNIARTKNGIK